MLTIHDYDKPWDDIKDPKMKIPNDVEKISIGYHRGRLSIAINGKTLYENGSVGSDISIDLDKN